MYSTSIRYLFHTLSVILQLYYAKRQFESSDDHPLSSSSSSSDSIITVRLSDIAVASMPSSPPPLSGFLALRSSTVTRFRLLPPVCMDCSRDMDNADVFFGGCAELATCVAGGVGGDD